MYTIYSIVARVWPFDLYAELGITFQYQYIDIVNILYILFDDFPKNLRAGIYRACVSKQQRFIAIQHNSLPDNIIPYRERNSKVLAWLSVDPVNSLQETQNRSAQEEDRIMKILFIKGDHRFIG